MELLEHGDADRVVEANLRLKLLDPQLGDSCGEVVKSQVVVVTPHRYLNKT